jgi:hypothetical protein
MRKWLSYLSVLKTTSFLIWSNQVTWAYAYNVLDQTLGELRLQHGQQDASDHEWSMIAAAERIMSVMRVASTKSELMSMCLEFVRNYKH